MHSKKDRIIVGITTYNSEWLRVSLPALSRLRRQIFLIICNDNPSVRISRRQIRRIGYHGNLHIINNDETWGTLFSRMKIVSAMRDLKIKSKWMVFADDDDILLNVNTPDVSDDIYAVIQNSVAIRNRVLDLFRVMDDPDNYIIDNENVLITRPNRAIGGALLRCSVMTGLLKQINAAADKIREIDENIDCRPPTDAIMWSYINTYARMENKSATPIYMDSLNYIKTEFDSSAIKYRRRICPARGYAGRMAKIVARYNAALFPDVESGETAE